MSERETVRWEQAFLGVLVVLAGLSTVVLAEQAAAPRLERSTLIAIDRLSASQTVLEASVEACDFEEPEG